MSLASTSAKILVPELPEEIDDEPWLTSVEAPPDPLEVVLQTFTPATPELLGQRALLSRIDTKFVVRQARLFDILGDLHEDYAVLQVQRGSIATYESLYFDTPCL